MSGGGGSQTTGGTVVGGPTPQAAAIAGFYQSQAANAAAQAATEQTNQAIDMIRQQYNNAFTNLKPYTTEGIQALDKLNSLMGLTAYDPGTSPSSPTKPTVEDYLSKVKPQQIRDYINANTSVTTASNKDNTNYLWNYSGVGGQPGDPYYDAPRKTGAGYNQPGGFLGAVAREDKSHGVTDPGYFDPSQYVLGKAPGIKDIVTNQVAQQMVEDAMPGYNVSLDTYNQQMDLYNYAKQLQAQSPGPLTPDQVSAELAQQPGYQFQLGQGVDAIQRAASSKGQLGSGRLLQSLVDYGQGMASQTYGDTLSRLAGLAGSGQSAANSTASLNQSLGGTMAGLKTNLGDTIANSYLAQGNAMAQAFLAPLANQQYKVVGQQEVDSGGGGLGGIGSILGGLGSIASSGLFSSRTLKDKVSTPSTKEILDNVKELEIDKWKYKGIDAEHIGPYAEDFAERFGVGNGTSISVIDLLGVLLASVKELSKQVDELKSEESLMAIQWGQLSPIAGSHVVGSLPVITPPANNDANSLAGGIMSGIAQGQQIAASKQQMDQAKQLFPSTLKQSENAAASSSIDLQNKQVAQQSAAEMATQYAQSQEKGDTYMQQHDPVGFAKMRVDRGNYDKAVADAAKASADAVKQQLLNADQIVITGAHISNAALTGRTPEEQAAIFNYYLSILKIESPKLAAIYPQEWNVGTARLLVDAGTEAVIRQKQEEEAKNMSDKQKNAVGIGKLKEQIRKGDTSQQTKDELSSLEQQTKPTSLVQSPGNQVKAETTSKYLQTRDTSKAVSVTNIASLDMMGKLSDSAMAGTGAETNLAIQKAISALTGATPNPKVPLTEALGAFAKTYQISQQMLMKGSSSERDMDLLAETGPQIANTAQGRKLMANQLGYKESMTINQVDFEHAWSDTHDADMTGAQDAWNKFVQTRTDFNPKTKIFDSRPTSKDWKPFLDENYEAPKAKIEFKEGQMYQDANGNKATYKNGKWESQ